MTNRRWYTFPEVCSVQCTLYTKKRIVRITELPTAVYVYGLMFVAVIGSPFHAYSFFVSSCTHKCQFRNKMYSNTQLPRVRLSVGIFPGITIITELVAEGPSGSHVPQEGKPFLKIQPAQSHNKQNITLLICTLCMSCIVLRAPHRIQCFCCLGEGAVLSRNVCAIRGFLFL